MRKHIKPQNLILIGLMAATLLFSWIRLYFGVEITDEAFYVAEPYIVSQGAIPIINNWSLNASASIITVPLVYLYNKVTGDMEGIMLFMRFAFNIFKLSIAVVIFLLMKKHVKRSVIIMFLIPFMIFTPHSIPSLSYNNMSVMLLMLSNFFVIAAFLEKIRKIRVLYAVIAGIIIALSVLSYPAQIITCIIISIIILALEKKKYNTIEIIMPYCIGGLFLALIVTSMLSVKGGGIGNLITGLGTMLYDNPYFLLKGDYLKTNLPSIKEMTIMFIKYLLIVLTILAGFIIKNYIQRNAVNKISVKKLTILTLIISAIIYIMIIDILGYKSNTILKYVCAIMFPLPIILMLIIKEKKEIYYGLLWFIWLPSLIWLLTSSVFAWDGISSRYYALFAGALLSIPFATFALDELTDSSVRATSSKYILSISLTFMFLISFGINYYMYVYREDPINKLGYRINSGIYAGIYTTKERGKAIEALELKLKEYSKENETVLFMDTVPMAYLMSKALHCTPTTWDITQYSYGFNDDTLLQKYFAINDIPDKIIYIYTGRDKVLSIDKEGHEFNNFVNKHYKLIYKSDEPMYYIKVYSRNNTG